MPNGGGPDNEYYPKSVRAEMREKRLAELFTKTLTAEKKAAKAAKERERRASSAIVAILLLRRIVATRVLHELAERSDELRAAETVQSVRLFEIAAGRSPTDEEQKALKADPGSGDVLKLV